MVGGVSGAGATPEPRLYSAAFFAMNDPQLDMVALAAAPAVVPISVAALAAAVAEGARDKGRSPFGCVGCTGDSSEPDGGGGG